jgi:hypothetical protein
LLKIFEKHGTGLGRQSYHQQTANLEDIFSDIRQKGLEGDITAWHVNVYYNTLLQSNKKFDELFLERNKEYAQLPKEKMADLREQAESALINLFEHINALITINGTAEYQPLTDELNALINSYETNIERRHRSGNEPDDEVLNQDMEKVVA